MQVSEIGEHVNTISLQNLSQRGMHRGTPPEVAVVANAELENARELPTAT